MENRGEKDIFVLKALIHLLSGSYSDCINQIDKAFSEQELTHRQELSLRSLKVRSYFNLGFSNTKQNNTVLRHARHESGNIKKSLKTTINKIILASRKNNKSEVVNLTNEILDDLIQEKPTNYDTVVAIAAECANDLLLYDDRDKFLEALQTFPDSKALIAVYDFIEQVNQKSLTKSEAIEKLYDVYKGGHKHDQMGHGQYRMEPALLWLESAI